MVVLPTTEIIEPFSLSVLSNSRRKSNDKNFDKIGKDEVDYVENTNFYFR